jgi:hypothetical protein
MKRWRLNSIAARIAVTIVLAIILGFALELAVGASINRVQSLIGGLQDKGDTYFFANRFGILTFNPRASSRKLRRSNGRRSSPPWRSRRCSSPFSTRPYRVSAIRRTSGSPSCAP